MYVLHARSPVADLGLVLLVFAFYANLAVIATRIHDVPPAAIALLAALLAAPALCVLVLGRRRLTVDSVLRLMVAYLAVMAAASLAAIDARAALAHVGLFALEGLTVYAVVLNGIRTLPLLRQVIATLVLAGGLLGGLSLYQEIAQTYDRQFAGLAQRNLALEEPGADWGALRALRGTADVRLAQRAAGPIGEVNRYAQVLLVLVPLALFQYRQGRTGWRRLPAAAAIVLIVSGVCLTYSRGALTSLGALLLAMVATGTLRPLRALGAGAGVVVVAVLIAPGYLDRIASIRGVEGLFAPSPLVEADGAVRGRATEMLAAFHVFLDHPVLGVGPGQYGPHYSVAYQGDPDVAFRFLPTSRRAHNLYLETAAETGLLGLVLFIAIAGTVLARLWQARARLRPAHPALSELASALALSVFAYLCTAMFLHLSYQRYFWFLLALAGAAIRVMRETERGVSVP
jgi:putative inorganic carbon (HCO3(-)) transporter